MTDTSKFHLECDCTCGDFIAEIVDIGEKPEDDWISFSYNIPAFYAYQPHWKKSLKLIWSIITGKQYQLYEIIITRKEWEEFKAFVNLPLKTKERIDESKV